MERFIQIENIRHYRRLLCDPDIAKDPVRRDMLVRLLADELTKDIEPKPVSREVDRFEADLLAYWRHAESGVEFWASTIHRAK